MPITIPERLQAKLHSDTAYEGHIHTLIRNTRALITEKADFFPEYTIHGWSHIQAVLHHADKLIPDVTMEALSGRDAALLIAAVILHDLGMFLGEAGVRKLLTGPQASRRDARLDKQDWKTAWKAYLHEIRRYPEEKLLYHFGMSGAIEEPDLTKDQFTDLERLIVGDFLRRHHHRIAHEIALGTMYGDADVDVLQVGMDALGNRAFDTKDRKCIGILARSHGMPIRNTLDYVRREIGSRHLEKLVWLMAVLRLADALDADEQRAPDTRRMLEGIRTPVSVQEWTWNQRISRTDLDWDADADFKYVEAEPESTTEFVHLERWLEGVQRELDTCWAVLSELCDTQRFRLSIHRIGSNILEEERRESYGERFITKEARLNANPELLKLLVAPLYDDDPSCGVRELLQNAVDACNERAYLEKGAYRGQVHIRLDTKTKTMTVSDNGIGMDENVLLNYYLSAGASYRTSDQWFEQFATDRDPNIVRTGRFGVGVLATFLLGHHIRVTTRHMDDELGYTFEFGLEPKALDIKRPEEAPEIGTTITVSLKEDALKKLQEDYRKDKTWLNWYRFAEPSVRYWVDGEEYVSGKPFVPQDDWEMPGWFELPGTEFDAVYFGYPGEELYCNGIRIPDGYDSYGFSSRKKASDPWIGLLRNEPMIPYPALSVIDKRGRLQVDLSRQFVHDPQLKQLIDREHTRYMIALLLTADWSSEVAAAEHFLNGAFGQRSKSIRDNVLLCAEAGYTILNPVFWESETSLPLLVFHIDHEVDRSALVRMLRCLKPTTPFILCPRFGHEDEWDSICEHLQPNRTYLSLPHFIQNNADTMWMSRRFLLDIYTGKTFIAERYRASLENGKEESCICITKGSEPQAEPFTWDHWDPDICPAISIRTVRIPDWMSAGYGREAKLRETILNLLPPDDPWIPYDMEARRKKFPKAFEELKYYIDRILADREKK